MTGFLRKSAFIGLLSMFSLVSLFGVATDVYAKADKPSISISDKSSNSVVLSVKQRDLKRDKVSIKVRVENIATGEKFNRTFKVTLNKDGKKKVTIGSLLANTQYKVKAQIRKRSQDTYSNFSSSKKFLTSP